MKLKWQDELYLYRDFKTTFVLEGNIYDNYPYLLDPEDTTGVMYRSLERFLYQYYKYTLKYDIVLFVNAIDGIYAIKGGKKEEDFKRYTQLKKELLKLESASEKESLANLENPKPSIFSFAKNEEELNFPARQNLVERFTPFIKLVYENTKMTVAFIMTQASRYTIAPDNLRDHELSYFTELAMTAQRRVVPGTEITNPNKNANNLVFITEKVNDMPFWFYFNNPYVKSIQIGHPTNEERKLYFSNTFEKMFGYQDVLEQNRKDEFLLKFVGYTEGLKTIEIDALVALLNQEKIPLLKLPEAVTLFKYGIRDNPWDSPDLLSRIPNLDDELKTKIFGQDEVINQAVDIVRRAVYGFSGIQSKRSSKPKGVMFLSGPTGTGKTELAKLITEWLFGKVDSLIRFDMSEFQQEHSDQRLLGAPPGYVGYSEGGQLTNAVKQNPFSVLLFDEIEKANPKILDKFLQILDDGRMTDGRGETVYFTDTIIIFTSNLGIKVMKRDDVSGRVIAETAIAHNHTLSREVYESKMSDSIKNHFDTVIGRPELLNRFADNFLIFNYISVEAMKSILNQKLNTVKKALLEDKKISLSWTNVVFEDLLKHAIHYRDKGGRGIVTLVEKHFINPLVRLIADSEVGQKNNLTIAIDAIVFTPVETSLAGKITKNTI
jgi:flagellar biosynthesis GTPase FlhF